MKRSGRIHKRTASWAMVGICTLGCQSQAPISVWSAPNLGKMPPGPLAIAAIAGDAEIAHQLESSLLETQPAEIHQVIPPEQLTEPFGVQRVSGDNYSDISALTAARNQGAATVLLGEVLVRREQSMRATRNETPDRIGVAWRVLDATTGETLGEDPTSMDATTAVLLHPELAYMDLPKDTQILKGLALECWAAVTPHVESTRIRLATARWLGGARTQRSGNVLAKQGRWPEAERRWQAALLENDKCHAAAHNLALAAVARQDFDTARRMIHCAMSMHRSAMYEETYGWIEKRRREYHDAFHLPDPDDGWPLSAR